MEKKKEAKRGRMEKKAEKVRILNEPFRNE
jgi:hypothetical protein